mmetsp:Transcript_32572/g.37157  ORF Transcript_32572/g.37157 Transcript_32572/m.37157 type:complete len:97 (+) Transcript_32572:129-419(+)
MLLLPFGWYFLNHNAEIMLCYVYVLVPILDMVLKEDHMNLSNYEAQKYEKDKRFLIPLYTVIIVDFVIYFWACYIFSFHYFASLREEIMFLISAIH